KELATCNTSEHALRPRAIACSARERLKILGLKRLKSDDGVSVLDAGDALHLFVDEVTDVSPAIDVEFHEQIVVAGRRVDLGCNFRLGQVVGYLVGLSELAFDLNEKGGHRRPPQAVRNPAKTRVAGKAGAAAALP